MDIGENPSFSSTLTLQTASSLNSFQNQKCKVTAAAKPAPLNSNHKCSIGMYNVMFEMAVNDFNQYKLYQETCVSVALTNASTQFQLK